MQDILNYGLLGLGLVMALSGFFWRRSVLKKQAADPEQKLKKAKTWSGIVTLAGAWFFVQKLLLLVFGAKEAEAFSVSIWAERIEVGFFSLSTTVIFTWAVMAALIILALLLRLLVIPKMTEIPHGVQNVLELAVETICNFTKTSVTHLHNAGNLPAYLFTVALFMVGCAMVELFGVRAPTADITMTFTLALITFFLINFYGIKQKGFGGRLASMAKPTPVIFPIKVVTDIAIPVSLACRLFGNMLGGMIVMDLLYMALGNAAVGIPSILGLYFNVFHPLIQAYIFITLTLTFISEAVE